MGKWGIYRKQDSELLCLYIFSIYILDRQEICGGKQAGGWVGGDVTQRWQEAQAGLIETGKDETECSQEGLEIGKTIVVKENPLIHLFFKSLSSSVILFASLIILPSTLGQVTDTSNRPPYSCSCPSLAHSSLQGSLKCNCDYGLPCPLKSTCFKGTVMGPPPPPPTLSKLCRQPFLCPPLPYTLLLFSH